MLRYDSVAQPMANTQECPGDIGAGASAFVCCPAHLACGLLLHPLKQMFLSVAPLPLRIARHHRLTSNGIFLPSGSSQNAPPRSRARIRFGSVIGNSPYRPLNEPLLDVT